jgi:hypothetical protein
MEVERALAAGFELDGSLTIAGSTDGRRALLTVGSSNVGGSD